MSLPQIALVAVLALCCACPAEPVDVEAKLAELQAADLDVRRAAIAELQTSDDPRIPRACLALLQDEGNSTRRLALRAIGSRHAQIPAAEVREFLLAIAVARPAAEHGGYLSMLERAEGLLARKYGSEMFAPSPDGRYVVYERRGLACVLDTRTGKEALVGKRGEELFSAFLPFFGNGPVRPRAHWHAASNAVALEMIFSRHARGLWIYDPAADRETVLDAKTFAHELGVPENAKVNIFGVRFIRFEAEEIVVEVAASVPAAPGVAAEATEKSVVAARHLKTGQARILTEPDAAPNVP